MAWASLFLNQPPVRAAKPMVLGTEGRGGAGCGYPELPLLPHLPEGSALSHTAQPRHGRCPGPTPTRQSPRSVALASLAGTNLDNSAH